MSFILLVCYSYLVSTVLCVLFSVCYCIFPILWAAVSVSLPCRPAHVSMCDFSIEEQINDDMIFRNIELQLILQNTTRGSNLLYLFVQFQPKNTKQVCCAETEVVTYFHYACCLIIIILSRLTGSAASNAFQFP